MKQQSLTGPRCHPEGKLSQVIFGEIPDSVAKIVFTTVTVEECIQIAQ
jgi:hypothetical protein